MRIAGWLMLEDRVAGGVGRVRLTRGWLRVQEGQIVEVQAGEDGGDCELGGPGFIVMPGLIDAHVHLPQFGIIGAYGLTLLDWLSRVTFPAERAWADEQAARSQTRSAIERMLRCGTTGFAAYATVHAEATQAAIEVAKKIGVRAHIGQVLMDRNAPKALCPPAGQQLDETRALLDRYPPGKRVSAAVTPRFALTCSEALLIGAGELARSRGALIQTHLAETLEECAAARKAFGKADYTSVYEEAGLLTPRTVLGHGIYLDQAELSTLAEHGASIAHCPTANSFLMSGRFNRHRTQAAGIHIALGSDIGGGYEVSMVRVARAMVQTAWALVMEASPDDKDALQQALSSVVSEAWHTITAGNADALGWPDAGRIAMGCPADLILVQPEIDLSQLDAHLDPLAAMLFGWDDRWVHSTLLRGQVAWSSGQGSVGKSQIR